MYLINYNSMRRQFSIIVIKNHPTKYNGFSFMDLKSLAQNFYVQRHSKEIYDRVCSKREPLLNFCKR